jgi:acyl-CoA reductase-like NAD-dependent aldehyde dehydrogenase
VINVITGSGATLGDALVRHPQVAKVAMTGSTATGKRILESAAPLLKKVSLELGGHCPAIVCADADIEIAAQVIAYKGFRNCGQSCSSINRVYAHESIHDALVLRLKQMTEALSIGDAVKAPASDLGPMTTEDGLRTTIEHIEDAIKQGATLVCGGRRPEGLASAGRFFLPTILTGAHSSMRVMTEETFGPVVPFAKFAQLDEAIAAANATPYGLVAYLFTRDTATTIKASESLEAGTVCVNHGAVNTNYGPYSGWKESGYGLELSRRAVFEYLKTRHTKIRI